MPGLLPDVDPDGLLEYSVVYTDRSLNHMSQRFQGVMRDVSATLKRVYRARSAVIVPGSGTFGMEAVARQFATNQHCLVIRNGQFSYRWSQILEMGAIAASTTVLKARRLDPQDPHSPFAPAPIEEVERTIREERPGVVFAPHVETSAGLLLPDDYLKRVAAAVHDVGGLFVLDCIASGTLWVDMVELGIDVLVSAPQKGWSGLPCCGMVMLSEAARKRIEQTVSTSFACDLRKWLSIMETYENGGHAYHATMPTDGLARLRDIMHETAEYGFERVCEEQWALGQGVRELLARYGYRSVAAPGFEAPGVVVCYTEDPGIVAKFAAAGLQVAGGVPLMCDEGADYQAFRIGLFGLDKLHNRERSLTHLETALKQLA
ncbi:MAG: aminotransferase class V-fold PLP-dependent enzyme [Halomonas sp.]|jgi:aspartate aminotransferase-like enzyme|uniref:Alanine--glyoxylate aminotransferase family protein n=1 Tax=Billgrantia tianxiuensis TaxID=2497861 RepID=A0A6I6SLZ3_9GAMM|nr:MULTISPECIES: aminotransferase class V-fold PLP-dependent enzyme [Halomonas]MCE8032659.1 alanine--glyoxylate aminotransferase family protein [Halomonas sp. MCCC 1A11057]MDX5432097.1 aminotransferase class V-fold PLP-dependent enzyme [Halomonas sp.]QHC49424.1 alanine--glyoxylate aminotransferase family protein [Halomonas tianxiuensis]